MTRGEGGGAVRRLRGNGGGRIAYGRKLLDAKGEEIAGGEEHYQKGHRIWHSYEGKTKKGADQRKRVNF